MENKTIAQFQSEWVAHGKIAVLQAKLNAEPHAEKRKALEDDIAAQRKLIRPD